ncbi:MAG: YceI family protein [Bdellovibrionales bacterium]
MIAAIFSLFTAMASAATAPAGHYTIDADHSNVGFEVSHLGISLVVGRFDKLSGTIEFNPNGASTVAVEIDPSSINTKVAQRDSHLRSADFFNVSVFPKMSFQSTAVQYDGEGNPVSMEGLLTMHGATQPVRLEITAIGAGSGPLGDVRAGYKAVGKIKRSAFGMNSLLAVAGDEVSLTLNIEAIQQ